MFLKFVRPLEFLFLPLPACRRLCLWSTREKLKLSTLVNFSHFWIYVSFPCVWIVFFACLIWKVNEQKARILSIVRKHQRQTRIHSSVRLFPTTHPKLVSMSTVFKSRARTSHGDLKQPWESFQLIQFITQKTIRCSSLIHCAYFCIGRATKTYVWNRWNANANLSSCIWRRFRTRLSKKTHKSHRWVNAQRSFERHTYANLLIRQSYDRIAAEAISHWADEIQARDDEFLRRWIRQSRVVASSW